jgi:hypothetical protein
VFVVFELSEFFKVNFYFPPNFSQSLEFSMMILMRSQLIDIIIVWGKNEQQRSSFPLGALVHAKAMHITALIECHRRYGSNAKTKLVNGMVSELKLVPASNQKQTVTLISATYRLGGQCKKVATLNSRSVKAGHVAAIPNEGNRPGTELVTWVSIPIDIADETSTAHEANDVDGMPSNIDKHTESKTIVPAGLPIAPEGDPQEDNAVQVDNKNNAASQTAATAHGIEWVRASVNASPLNGNFPRLIWSIRNSVGGWCVGSKRKRCRDTKHFTSRIFVDVSSQAADWYGPLDKHPPSEMIKERDNAQWGPQILWDPNPNYNIWVHVKNICVEYNGIVQVLTGTSVRVDRDVKEQVWRPVQLHEVEFSTGCSNSWRRIGLTRSI